MSGKISVASGNNGGSYATVFDSSVVKSHDITQSVQGDWTETLFTTIGEKISIKSSSGLLSREVTPGPVYLDFLDEQYVSPAAVADFGFFELTDAQKSYTFISDLFRSSTTPVEVDGFSFSRGDLNSYYVQSEGEYSYDVEFTENNLVNKLGSFFVLSESISGAIDSSAKIGSNFFIMNLSTVYKEITGDTYSLEIEPLPGDDTYTNIDSFIGDKVSLKGEDVYFHASRESTFGDLKIDAKNNTVVNIIDSDVIKSAVEGDGDFAFGKTFGFTYSGESYYEELSKIVGAKIDVKAKGLVDFTLKAGASYIDQMGSPSSNSRVAGDINLSGQQINAIFDTADVAKSIIYDGVTAINGDTSNFLGAGLKFSVKGVSGEQSSLIVDDSLFGKVDMSLKKGSAIVDFDESIFSTDLEYNYKWWDRNGVDPDLEVTTEPVDNPEWKYDYENYYSTEHLNALTGANVKIKGDLSVDFSAERSVMGNVDITAGKSSSAGIQFIDSVIASSISVDDSGYYNFSDGSIKVSAQQADVTLTNSYVSLLDLTKVKSGSIVRFNYDVSDTASRIDFLNPQTIEDGTTPEGFNYQTPSLESMQVNLKTNKTADEFFINSPALSLTLTLNGFEWGIDKIYLDSDEINYTSEAYEGLLNPISKGYYLDFEFFA